MSVRVRFAPSPTGYLHIGGARTALYSYLFARAQGGHFVIRVEDTDRERSQKKYETSQLDDLEWLGIVADEDPRRGGDYGPYRQSERVEIYQRYAQQLLEQGQAFYCFCSDVELEAAREKALAEQRDPHYDGTHRDLPLEEARRRLAQGEQATIRFKVPRKKVVVHDLVRGEVEYPDHMVGDFVIIRSDGMPVYNFCCVVDDHLMQMSHVLRAEEHLNNTVRQLMLYEALGWTPPQFGHLSLLIGKDRQKLSKRHGATSVSLYREEGYLPQAMVNYLSLLGWSHPQEKDIFTMEEILPLFDLTRFSKSPSMYDVEKLNHVNTQHMKELGEEEWLQHLSQTFKDIPSYSEQSKEWQQTFIQLIRDKIHCFHQARAYYEELFNPRPSEDEEAKEVLSWESTTTIKEYLQKQIGSLEVDFVPPEMFQAWEQELKGQQQIKGKFLFKGLRVVLTGRGHGPDLKTMLRLIPVRVLQERMQ